MQVLQVEWLPAEVTVGQNTAFHWEIANADKCYSSLSPQTAKAAKGQTTNYQYQEPSVYVTKWHCFDSAGNRFPADESQFLEATRTVTAKPPEPQSQIIFVHTDLLGSPVVETNEQGAEF